MLAAKDHAAQFIAQALGFLCPGSVAETLGQPEKLPLIVLRFHAEARGLFRKIHNTNMHDDRAIS